MQVTLFNDCVQIKQILIGTSSKSKWHNHSVLEWVLPRELGRHHSSLNK